MDNVFVYPFALGSYKHVSRFVCYTNNAFGRFLDNKSFNSRQPVKDVIDVGVETIDNLFSKRVFNHIDLIKIDVEGFEFDVLKGAVNALKQFHPIIIFEFNNQFDSFNFLKSLDYDLFVLDKYGGLADIDNSNLKNNDNIVAKQPIQKDK